MGCNTNRVHVTGRDPGKCNDDGNGEQERATGRGQWQGQGTGTAVRQTGTGTVTTTDKNRTTANKRTRSTSIRGEDFDRWHNGLERGIRPLTATVRNVDFDRYATVQNKEEEQKTEF